MSIQRLWTKVQGEAIAVDCFFVPSHRLQGIAKALMSFGRTWAVRGRPAKQLHRFIHLRLFETDRSERAERTEVRWVFLKNSAQQRLSFFPTTDCNQIACAIILTIQLGEAARRLTESLNQVFVPDAYAVGLHTPQQSQG